MCSDPRTPAPPPPLCRRHPSSTQVTRLLSDADPSPGNKKTDSDGESYPILKEGVGCKPYTVVAGDTWLTIAGKNEVDFNALLIANPSTSGADPLANTRIFLPPCENGGEKQACWAEVANVRASGARTHLAASGPLAPLTSRSAS